MSPSTPASTAFSAPARFGTTWKTVSPASLSGCVYFVGLPAEVVTNFTPCSATNSTIDGSRTNAWAMFTPNGLSVRSRILRISSRMTSSSPDDVSMIPIAPALDTALASCDRAIQPIGACTIGMSTPSSSVTRLAKVAVTGAILPCTGQTWSSWPRVTVPVTRPRSWRSMAPVAPHTVSPTSSKKKIGRSSAHGNVQRSSRKMAGSSSSATGTWSTADTSAGLAAVSGSAGEGADVGDDERAARDRGEVVELADALDLGGVEGDLLARLAQRGVPEVGVGVVLAAAGEADLARSGTASSHVRRVRITNSSPSSS